MENKSNNSYVILKIVFITLSIITLLFALSGGVLMENGSGIKLTSFASFYVYIVAIIIAIIITLKKKDANFFIFSAIISYGLSYYLMYQTINANADIQITKTIQYYIYYGSAIFLVISLFFNSKKHEENDKKIIEHTIINNGININNYLFTKKIIGLQTIPYETIVLLVNDIENKSLNLLYSTDDTNKIIKLSKDTISNITYSGNVKIQNKPKKPDEEKISLSLLNAVTYKGTSLKQLTGENGYNYLFNTLFKTDEKNSSNIYYEVKITALISGVETKILLSSEKNPDNFVKEFNNNLVKKQIENDDI